MPEAPRAESRSILIKRYAGQRLYNTASLTYVSLDDLAAMVLAGQRFTVIDAGANVDTTAEILDQLS